MPSQNTTMQKAAENSSAIFSIKIYQSAKMKERWEEGKRGQKMERDKLTWNVIKKRNREDFIRSEDSSFLIYNTAARTYYYIKVLMQTPNT